LDVEHLQGGGQGGIASIEDITGHEASVIPPHSRSILPAPSVPMTRA